MSMKGIVEFEGVNLKGNMSELFPTSHPCGNEAFGFCVLLDKLLTCLDSFPLPPKADHRTISNLLNNLDYVLVLLHDLRQKIEVKEGKGKNFKFLFKNEKDNKYLASLRDGLVNYFEDEKIADLRSQVGGHLQLPSKKYFEGLQNNEVKVKIPYPFRKDSLNFDFHTIHLQWHLRAAEKPITSDKEARQFIEKRQQLTLKAAAKARYFLLQFVLCFWGEIGITPQRWGL